MRKPAKRKHEPDLGPMTTDQATMKYCTDPPCNMCLGRARACVQSKAFSVRCPRCGAWNWFDEGSWADEAPKDFPCVACGAPCAISA